MAASLHDGKPVEAIDLCSSTVQDIGLPFTPGAIPLRDDHGLIVGIIQTFESEFSVHGPNLNDRSMKERGCLDFATESPNQAMMQSQVEQDMFAIIGIIVVFGCVIGGFLMEHGNLRVLIQPAELVTIGGAAIGTVLIANPLHILKQIAAGIGGVFGGSKYTKQAYIDSLKTMYELLNKARKDGLMALENDVEEPDKSPILSKGPAVLKNHHIRAFVCDSLRMAITGVDAFDLDQMLDLDLDVHHHQAGLPTAALSSMADSLPAWALWPRCWASSSPWEHWVALRKRSEKGCGGAGWHISGHPIVLWPGWSDCSQHG